MGILKTKSGKSLVRNVIKSTAKDFVSKLANLEISDHKVCLKKCV